MKAKAKAQLEPSCSDDNLTIEEFERKLARIDAGIEFCKKGKPVPECLQDPKWTNIIIASISEMELPLKGKLPTFSEAAKWGYQFARDRHHSATLEAHTPHGMKELQDAIKLRKAIEIKLVECNQNILNSLKLLPLPKLVEVMEGFAYGIICWQHKKESGEPIRHNPRWPLYKTILRHEESIQQLVRDKKNAAQISEFIASKLPHPFRNNYAASFEDSTKNKTVAWYVFVNRVYKLCKEVGINGFPKRGRPGRK